MRVIEIIGTTKRLQESESLKKTAVTTYSDISFYLKTPSDAFFLKSSRTHYSILRRISFLYVSLSTSQD